MRRQALVVGSLTLIVAAVSLLREQVTAFWFGAGPSVATNSLGWRPLRIKSAGLTSTPINPAARRMGTASTRRRSSRTNPTKTSAPITAAAKIHPNMNRINKLADIEFPFPFRVCFYCMGLEKA
jgi:hypothetical protein